MSKRATVAECLERIEDYGVELEREWGIGLRWPSPPVSPSRTRLRRYLDEVQEGVAEIREEEGVQPDGVDLWASQVDHLLHSIWDEAFWAGRPFGLNMGGVQIPGTRLSRVATLGV